MSQSFRVREVFQESNQFTYYRHSRFRGFDIFQLEQDSGKRIAFTRWAFASWVSAFIYQIIAHLRLIRPELGSFR